MKNNQEISEKYTLNKREFNKGLLLGLFGAICGYLANLFADPTFNVFEAFNDWQTIVQGIISSSITYLAITFVNGHKK